MISSCFILNCQHSQQGYKTPEISGDHASDRRADNQTGDQEKVKGVKTTEKGEKVFRSIQLHPQSR